MSQTPSPEFAPADRPVSGAGPSPARDDAPPQRYSAALAGAIESFWQNAWAERQTFRAPNPGEPGFDPARPKKFILDMFPYPSGAGLHVGHPLGYIATDIYARFLRMTGHSVLHAMGYDAFGLPAEQYAVQTNTHPRVTTERNIATMRAQLRRLGLAHDDRRGVSTTDEAFYRWTQWIFLKIYDAWYDPQAPAPGGRARPIAELRALLASGQRATRAGKPWARMSPAEREDEIDAHRLAYLDQVSVNWCPMLGTVLANEEVIDGRSERGNFPVYQRPLKQWMMRITAYADRLADDLAGLDWPEATKQMQRHWIGRSRGAHADFECAKRRIRVFTTRPDTLYGATFLVLSPEHPMLDQIIPEKYGEHAFERAVFPGAEALVADGAAPRRMVDAYRRYAASRTQEQRTGEAGDKTGCFTGAYAVNPVGGARVPVFIADYVLAGYGTGAIMAVPAHDERDFAFAQRFRLPVIRVVQPATPQPALAAADAPACFSGEGVAINSPVIDGLPTEQAKAKIIAHLTALGRGEAHTTYKLRDWLFSRQRYWGEPFPIVFGDDGRAVALPESMLPVRLPHMDNFQPESSEDPDAPVRTPLGRAAEWSRVRLDLSDGRGERDFTRETNTMPNWAGSCWYYLRYLDPANDHAFVDPQAERWWMSGRAPTAESPPPAAASSPATMSTPGGVDLYVGGVEHAVLHLLYARFWHKVLFDLGLVSTPEPFQRLFNQGYIQAHAFTDERGFYVEAARVVTASGQPALEHADTDGPFFFEGRPVKREYGKMGKSLKNVVAPDEVCEHYGCDTLRVYEMSMGPLEASKPWNTRDIAGAHRFLQRAWRCIIDEHTGLPRTAAPHADPHAAPDAPTLRILHKTIDGVRRDMASLGFNTAVAKLIELVNELTKLVARDGAIPRVVAEALTLMLAPLAPHMAEELWKRLGHERSLAYEPFPVADPALARDDEVEIAVQVLGKVRARLTVPAGTGEDRLRELALADERIRPLLDGKPVKKVIVVPGKLVNVVV